ncbi:ABC transporter permease, partial [Leisingera sp. ANG-M1]|uniref:ABC transporter permease n=1 Tax=Leisingera sp. ANG-M1 TaxID=1577895 RepID=UPI000580A034
MSMLDLAELALRNTARNTRRTLFTLISITIGCAAMICFAGFISFTFEGLRETTIRTQLGHFQVFRQGYFEKRHSDKAAILIEDITPVEAALAEVDHVTTVTSRLSFAGIGGTGGASLSMQLVGADPDRETEFADFEIVVEGRNLRPGDESAGVIGFDLKLGLGAEIGDWVTVMTTTLDGVFNAIEFQIVGVVSTGSKAYDAVYAKVPISLAQSALDTKGGERVIVLLDDTAHLNAATRQLTTALADLSTDYEIRSWQELAEYYDSVVALYSGLFRVFAVIVVVVVIFSVVNTMTMSVLERTSELSALRAMGATGRVIVAMIMLEGAILGLAGAALGLALSLAVSAGIDRFGGIEMPPPPAMSQG